ncbi:XdhC family protein [Streptomyces sp. 8L]|uniref:XdhC family protein n=1 Tax=Streptomyces sp. 8L TaxID=2877242 RepID=UPI001CD203B2|nr:XdhC family protein [Streptomyces sp. 8L]MCA1217748.1 XdhC family protein [Streptomyces sp. 8L]
MTTKAYAAPMSQKVGERVLQLSGQRVPFVHATVVRAQKPTSAHPGDEAIVYADGTIDGFVGGVCAESSVRTAALAALSDGSAVLLRVLPEGEAAFPESPGARVVVNPCLSGGALEIFLRPVLPPPLVAVVGDTPVAEAVVALAGVLGYAAERPEPGAPPGQAAAVVVASHGRDEERSIRAALDAGVRHVALVASRRRGAAVLDELGLDGTERARVSTPAGIDIGARTVPEVALSIMAGVVASVRSRSEPAAGATGPAAVPETGAGATTAPVQVQDPVCGMTVTVMPDTPHLEDEDGDHWFCSGHCKDRYAKEQVG